MIKQIKENIYSFEFQEFGCISYLVKINNQNILIDTSSKENEKELIDSLKELNLETKDIDIVILTHAHYDHIENKDLFSNAKIYANFNESIERDHSRKKLKNLIKIKNQPIKEFKIYDAPGHTPEDIVILYGNVLFSGDVIFHNGYIGRTDFPESDENKMKNSLEFLKSLNFEVLCPGH